MLRPQYSFGNCDDAEAAETTGYCLTGCTPHAANVVFFVNGLGRMSVPRPFILHSRLVARASVDAQLDPAVFATSASSFFPSFLLRNATAVRLDPSRHYRWTREVRVGGPDMRGIRANHAHEALDRDEALHTEVRNAAKILVEAVTLARAGKLPQPGERLQDPRPK